MRTLFADPPSPVDFEVNQYCNEMMISWTSLSDSPRPITGYNITINDSKETVAANQTTYNFTISDSDCGSILQISMSAISAAGTGKITTISLLINCTHECTNIP